MQVHYSTGSTRNPPWETNDITLSVYKVGILWLQIYFADARITRTGTFSYCMTIVS